MFAFGKLNLPIRKTIPHYRILSDASLHQTKIIHYEKTIIQYCCDGYHDN
jgi:hypothetical protein